MIKKIFLMMEVRLIVCCHKLVYDDLELTPDYVKNHEKNNALEESKSIENKKCDEIKTNVVSIKLDKQVAGAYVHLLKSSDVYRQLAHKYLVNELVSSNKLKDNIHKIVFFLKLKKTVEKEFLDYKWNERITILAIEQREIDYAMSWLSTLGGAFSSQGFNNQACAKTAGKISIHQFKLSMRLGNPLLVSRCKLYACLSLIQQGNIKLPRKLIPEIFKFSIEEKDKHLERMCQGIWATLRYTCSLKKKKSR